MPEQKIEAGEIKRHGRIEFLELVLVGRKTTPFSIVTPWLFFFFFFGKADSHPL